MVHEIVIRSTQTIEVEDDEEAPIQFAEARVQDLLHELEEQGAITDYSIVGPEQ